MPRFSSTTSLRHLNASGLNAPAAPAPPAPMDENDWNDWVAPLVSYHPRSSCASGMSGSTAMVELPETLSERPPKSPTLTPLMATMPLSSSVHDSAWRPHSVTRTAYCDRSTMVNSRFLICFCVALAVISDTAPLSCTTPSTSHVPSLSMLVRSDSCVKLNWTCGTSFSSACVRSGAGVSVCGWLKETPEPLDAPR